MRRSRWTGGIAVLVATGAWIGNGASADLSLTGGSITLTVSAATAGSQPDPVDNTNCGLAWTTGGADPTQKITVRSSLGDPEFPLTVEAQSVTAGTATGSVAVSVLDTDLITDIAPNSTGSGQLHYQVSPTVAAGSGTESHTITYTITAQ